MLVSWFTNYCKHGAAVDAFLRPMKDEPGTVDLRIRLARLAQVKLSADLTSWPEKKKELIKALLEAGNAINEAYLRQWYPAGVALRDRLANRTDEFSGTLYRLVVRNGGPFDKMDHFSAFYGNAVKPPGCGYYPDDLTKQEFEEYVDSHPHQRAELLSPYTIIRREDGRLKAVPFHEAYSPWLETAAAALQKASELSDHPSLKRFLASRATALLTDDYFQSDADWVDVADSDIDLVIGPYEVYDDELMGLKASYEVSIGLRNEEESDRLKVYAKHLDALEQHLPHATKYKRQIAGVQSTMVVLSDLYRGGDMATGYQAAAANLPNDPRIHTLKGTKKMFWKNIMDARMEHIVAPLGRALLAPAQMQFMTSQGMFNFILMHELSHALGPRYVHDTGESLTVNQALKDLHSVLEETKADLAALHSVKYLVDHGVFPADLEPEVFVSFVACMLRSMRFGTQEAHGRAAICEFNFLRSRRALVLDRTGKWCVAFGNIASAVVAMAAEVLTIQATGDYNRASGFLQEWGRVTTEIEETTARCRHLPIDIDPVYSIVWD